MMFIQGSRQAVIAAVVGVAVTLTAFFYLRYTENEKAHEALEVAMLGRSLS